MRVDCYKCGAAYMIPDEAVTPGGVRAECPKCGHQETVRIDRTYMGPSPGSRAPDPSGTSREDLFDLDRARPAPAAAPGSPADDPFAGEQGDPFAEVGGTPIDAFEATRSPAPPPPPRAPGAPAPPPLPGAPAAPPAPPAAPRDASSDPFGGASSDPFGGASSDPFGGASSDPFGGDPADPFSDDADPFAGDDSITAEPFGGARAPGKPQGAPKAQDPFADSAKPQSDDPFADDDPFAEADPFAADGPVVVGGGARPPASPPGSPAPGRPAPGRPAPGRPGGGRPGAASLGRITPASMPAAEPAAHAGPVYRVKKPDGRQLGPVDLQELGAMAGRGEVAPGDQIARDADEYRLFSQYPECAPLLAEAARHTRVKAGGSAYRPEKRSWLPLVLGLLLVLIVGGGAGVFFFAPDLLPASVRGLLAPKEPERPPNPVHADLAIYRLQVMDASGTPAEHLQKARESMALDTIQGYRDADQSLKRALLLDPDDVKAISLYVLNSAWATRTRPDPAAARTALSYAGYLAEVAPDDPEALQARAAALLMLGSDQAVEARRLAERALEKAPGNPEAKLLEARANAPIDIEAAVRKLRDLGDLPDSPARARLELGLACMQAGDFRCAEEGFQARLKRTPGHEEAAEQLAQLYVVLGHFDQARRVYVDILAADPDRVDAGLAVAMLDYQVDGDLKAARRRLQRLVSDKLAFADEELARRVLTHAATVERLSGRLGDAEKVLQQVFAEEALHGPANYQGTLVALLRKDVALATDRLASAAGDMDDPVKKAILQAALEARAGNDAAAVREARAAADASSALGPLLLAAALEGRRGQTRPAYMLLREVRRMDPWEARQKRVGDYHDGQVLNEVLLDGMEALVRADPNQGLAHAGLGVARWYVGDLRRARTHLWRALDLDGENVLAHIYLGQIAAETRRPAAAERHFRDAIQADRLSALPRYLLGRSLELRGDAKAAALAYSEALQIDPAFHLARIRESVLLGADRRKVDEAREQLRKVLLAHPRSVAARVALYEVGQ